jgi:hypothetical protein
LLEPQEETVPEALATLVSIEQLHGTGATTWPMLAEAARL